MGDALLGVKVLDELLGDALEPPATLLLVGHPGAGKTTLASQICHHNAVGGQRCLYVTFYEDRERLYRSLGRLGIDMAGAEAAGALRFVRLPLTLNVEAVAEELGNLIASYGPKVIVVDSINALLEGVGGDWARRAWLQNYLYGLARAVGGLVVLVAEAPYGEERAHAGPAEFVADVVLYLKHRVERGLLARILEIRKARGAPITVAELPFTIGDGGVLVQPVEAPLTIPSEGGALELPCAALKRSLGALRFGEVVYVSYPPDARLVEGPGMGLFLVATAVLNGIRALVVSFRYSGETLRELFVEQLTSAGVERGVAEAIVERHFEFAGLNPFSAPPQYYPPELADPAALRGFGAAVFHGLEVRYASMGYKDYVAKFFDVALRLKKAEVLHVALAARVSRRQYRTDAALSDVVVRLSLRGSGEAQLFLWRKGGNATLLGPGDLGACYEEALGLLRGAATRPPTTA